MSSDGSDSGGDIPFKDAEDAKPADSHNAGDEEGDEEEEEEYAVEKILGHKFQKKTLFFEVKWLGYDETTIEPEDNLDGCPEELATYYKSIGGRPEKPGKTPAKPVPERSASSRKRGSSTVDPEPAKKTTGRPPKKSKVVDDEVEGGPIGPGADTFKAPAGSWEDEIIGIETVTRSDKTGELMGFVEWHSQHKSRHPTRLLNFKCPQKMLRFYESHLFFYDPAKDGAKTKPETPGAKVDAGQTSGTASSAVPALAVKDRDDDNDEDAKMTGVKGVASGEP